MFLGFAISSFAAAPLHKVLASTWTWYSQAGILECYVAMVNSEKTWKILNSNMKLWNQVTSHGALNIYKYQQTGNSCAGCFVWISYKERHWSTENLTVFSEAIDTWGWIFMNRNQNHQDRTESTTSLLPIQAAMSTRIFTGDVADQSWDMKQPRQKKNKASHKSCDH